MEGGLLFSPTLSLSGTRRRQSVSKMSNFRQILTEVGAFGLFQKRLVAALCIPSVFVAFDVIGQVFTGMSYPHRCNTDWILERGPNLTDERKRNLTIPVNSAGTFESCEMFTPVKRDLETIEKFGINSTIGCVNGSDFKLPSGASSIVTEVRTTLYVYSHRKKINLYVDDELLFSALLFLIK